MQLWRYIVGTIDTKLVLKDNQEKQKAWLTAYTDSDWAGEKTSRSRSGNVIMYRGSCISWYSKLQTTVALSSTEAERTRNSNAKARRIEQRNERSFQSTSNTIDDMGR
jgi:hypothetical protein